MGLEAATYISGLVATNPVGATDPVSQGDDHLRLLKSALLNTFPAISGAVTATHGELSQLHGSVLSSLGDGAVGAPTYSFASDTDTGMYRNSPNDLRLVTGGVARFIVLDTQVLTRQLFYIPDGSVGSPSLSFENDTDTGIYRGGTNRVTITAGGSKQAEFGGGALVMSVQHGLIDGTVSAPGLYFVLDDDTGIFRASTNTLGLTAGGALAAFVDATGLELPAGKLLRLADGSVGAPAIQFANDADTGIYRGGADTLVVAAGGAPVIIVDSGNVVLGNSAGYILDLGAIGLANSATAGSATALPALPSGYAVMALTGSLRKFPYYNM